MSSNAYEIITAKLIEEMESGTIPWQKPWKSKDGSLMGRPRNLSSGNAYRGINLWILAAASAQFTSNYWLTYKQAQELGGQVRKGEKGRPVVFFKTLEKENSKGETDEIFMARYSTVFNTDQCEGLIVPQAPQAIEPKPFEAIAAAEAIVTGYKGKPEIRHEGNAAVYSPNFDYVAMPAKDSFVGSEEYYSTLFHELVHSTGHEKRLNREELKKVCAFGSHDYSKEELVAEIGSAFLCHESGISQPVIKNQAAYLQSWLKVLKNDRRLFVSAASKAEKAADHILGTQRV